MVIFLAWKRPRLSRIIESLDHMRAKNWPKFTNSIFSSAKTSSQGPNFYGLSSAFSGRKWYSVPRLKKIDGFFFLSFPPSSCWRNAISIQSEKAPRLASKQNWCGQRFKSQLAWGNLAESYINIGFVPSSLPYHTRYIIMWYIPHCNPKKESIPHVR